MTQDNIPPVAPETQTIPPVAPPAGEAGPLAVETNKDARLWGMLCHLGALAGLVIPFGSVIGPLVLWLVKKNDYPFVDDQGKEALNFQITVAIALLVSFLLIFVLVGFLLLPVVGITALVFTIIAAVQANNGVRYRYPLAIRFIK